MDLDSVKRSLEPAAGGDGLLCAGLPAKFYAKFVLHGLRVDLIEPGRILCSITVPPRFVNSRGVLHGSMVVEMVDVVGSAVLYRADSPTSVSLEISVSYVDAAFVDVEMIGSKSKQTNCELQRSSFKEEIEFDARILRFGNSIGVTTVEVRKKKTGKIIAQARHSKYLVASSRL
ncbi:hypothetical protein AXF42_Ash003434 [Apostasia shenzhenica]|uniref:Thioesterase domain-containing protein n=1 Tax=Apostasia shenzhenica TaxID=1088818 RepID=A0A2I0BG56_9ASPA|nr:hypothetical protein AXF42_Ash003434 [Apostasia shenzhenica]